MTKVRIYRPSKNAMQSGRGDSKRWAIDFEPAAGRTSDPLMGWTSGTDTQAQLRLRFNSKEEAIAYAERKGYDYTVWDPRERVVGPKSYAANFAPDRIS